MGNQGAAEDFPPYADIPGEQWIDQSASDPAKADYALEVARRSADATSASVTSIQNKAASLTTLVLGLAPVAIGVTALAIGDIPDSPVAGITSFVFFLASVVLLLVAAVRGFLCSGAVIVGAVNARRLAPSASSVPALKVQEADAWLFAADLGLRAIERRNRDLFAARRAVIWAFVLATLATPLLVIAHTAH